MAILDEPQQFGIDPRGSGSASLSLAATLDPGKVTANTIHAMLVQKAGPQSRKAFGDMIYITQLPSEEEKRQRELVHTLILALTPIFNARGEPMLFRYWVMGPREEAWYITRKEAEELWSLYDTHYEITPTFSNEMMQDIKGSSQKLVQYQKAKRKPEPPKTWEPYIDPVTGRKMQRVI